MNLRPKLARAIGLLVLVLAVPGTWATIAQVRDPGSLNDWLKISWPTFAHSPHHDGHSAFAAEKLKSILWQTPVDVAPQYSSGELLIHYATPLITPGGTVVVTVKVNPFDTFIVEGHRASDGTLLWTESTDYTLPSASWVPECASTLTPDGRLVMPAIGGTVLVRPHVDSVSSVLTREAFYGLSNYLAAPHRYDVNVKINTPIVSDDYGSVYFGFIVLGPTPLGLKSGIARIGNDGVGHWISASKAAGDSNIEQVPDNCTPALSQDGTILYVAVRNAFEKGYLLGLDSATLAKVYKIRLKDPRSNADALISDNSTASPCIGPDGEVFYGVLESRFPSNHARGWLLHFDPALTVSNVPGDFGWDSTPSIVPSSAVPSYTGTSSYLLVTKYNNYAVGGGDGVNKCAVLDPNASQTDPQTGHTVMLEVITVVGPTPDPGAGPNAVKEWCVNNIAVDVHTKSAILNSEDGTLYRWDFTTNTLTQSVVLTAGLGEAYTPTVIGVDGKSYAIGNAILFAVGK